MFFSDQGKMWTIISENKVQLVNNKTYYKHSINFLRYSNPVDLSQCIVEKYPQFPQAIQIHRHIQIKVKATDIMNRMKREIKLWMVRDLNHKNILPSALSCKHQHQAARKYSLNWQKQAWHPVLLRRTGELPAHLMVPCYSRLICFDSSFNSETTN